MPSMGRSGHSDTGSRRADIVPGDVDGSACGRGLRNLIEGHFQADGFSVKSNQPYKGGWITRHFGEPDHNVHAIQIEINRALYMDETTFEIIPRGLNRLRETCSSLVPLLGELEF